LKGRRAANQTTQGGERLILFHIGLTSNLKKLIYLSKQDHLYKK
jgi:hypothetical protein